MRFRISCVLKSSNDDQERYRSGRNGGASKASCRVTGTWVRIPPSPPRILTRFWQETCIALSKRIELWYMLHSGRFCLYGSEVR